MNKDFRDMVNYFTEKYFNKETKEDLFSTVCFFEHHPNINGYLLDAAITQTILSRPDFTKDITIPKEVIVSFTFYIVGTINFIGGCFRVNHEKTSV